MAEHITEDFEKILKIEEECIRWNCKICGCHCFDKEWDFYYHTCLGEMDTLNDTCCWCVLYALQLITRTHVFEDLFVFISKIEKSFVNHQKRNALTYVESATLSEFLDSPSLATFTAAIQSEALNRVYALTPWMEAACRKNDIVPYNFANLQPYLEETYNEIIQAFLCSPNWFFPIKGNDIWDCKTCGCKLFRKELHFYRYISMGAPQMKTNSCCWCIRYSLKASMGTPDLQDICVLIADIENGYIGHQMRNSQPYVEDSILTTFLKNPSTDTFMKVIEKSVLNRVYPLPRVAAGELQDIKANVFEKFKKLFPWNFEMDHEICNIEYDESNAC